jgi:hypothetical protein
MLQKVLKKWRQWRRLNSEDTDNFGTTGIHSPIICRNETETARIKKKLNFDNGKCAYSEALILRKKCKDIFFIIFNHEMFMVKLYQNTNVKSVKSEISY